MAAAQIGRGGMLAIALAVIGSLVALGSEVAGYRATGVVDWGHVALAIGVPAFIYAVVRGSSQPR